MLVRGNDLFVGRNDLLVGGTICQLLKLNSSSEVNGCLLNTSISTNISFSTTNKSYPLTNNKLLPIIGCGNQ